MEHVFEPMFACSRHHTSPQCEETAISVMVISAKLTHLWVAGVEVHCTQSPLWVGIEISISLHTNQT